MVPDALRPWSATATAVGERDAAIAVYERWLPLINYENKQCGLRATKALMAEGKHHRQRGRAPPARAAPPRTRAGLVELARRLDALILRWGR